MIYFFILFISATVCLLGQNSREMRLAESYFDAKDFEHAAAEYSGIYDDALPPWERAILLYNIGTARLAQGKWEDALKQFQLAALQNAEMPLLNQRLKSNKALALLMLANARDDEIKGNANVTDNDFGEALILYRIALTDMDVAGAADCALARAEGALDCPPPIFINEMRAEAKNRYAQLLKDYASFNEDAEKLGKMNPLERALQHLLVFYKLALANEPLDLPSLQKLSTEQEALNARLPTDSSTKSDYGHAQYYLALSQDALKDNLQQKARIFLEAARFFISSIAQKTAPSKKNIAESILESSIAKEEFSLLINRLLQQGKQSNFKEANELVQLVQRSVINVADDFLDAAVAQQKKAFAGNGDNSCQCRPWDEVVPLFNAGFLQALGANEILEKRNITPSVMAAVEQMQESTVNNWKEALAKLRAKPTSEKKTAEEKKSEEEKQNQNAESGKQELNNVLRLVQDMENDDRSKPRVKVSGVKGMERPW